MSTIIVHGGAGDFGVEDDPAPCIEGCLRAARLGVATEVVEELKRFGGDGALILVDAQDRVGFAFNSQRMARAWVDAEGREGSGFGR